MTIAGFKIIKCPFCTQLYKERIIGSYNTFSSKHYSDGYQKGPWLPVFYSVLKCVNNNCGKIFNLQKAELIKELDENEFSLPEWKDAYYLSGHKVGIPELEEAFITDYCDDSENEKQVRTLLYNRYNDVIRENKDFKLSLSEKAARINNIQKLTEFHKTPSTPSSKIYLAELYREKGDFETCLQILSEIREEKEYEKKVKEKIFSQAKLKNDKVFDISLIAIKKEYKCNHCNESIILFDLEKLESGLDYKHYKCLISDCLFSSPSKQFNPMDSYKLTFFQKLFKTKKPYQQLIPKTQFNCPNCEITEVELFNPETDKCMKCSEGNYIAVKWFDY